MIFTNTDSHHDAFINFFMVDGKMSRAEGNQSRIGRSESPGLCSVP
jgi:hypothetical protein